MTLSFFQQLLAPQRLRATLVAAACVFGLVMLTWQDETYRLALLVFVPALCSLLAYTLLERWPRHVPRPLARWAIQVVGVAAVVPLVELAFFTSATPIGAPPFWQDENRAGSFGALTFLGMLVSSWVAMTALMRQRDEETQRAERARGELERQALDSRLRLLQAQVEPHFLFNTLANVQALVDAGSPRASQVLASLVSYLRAAVPRLSEPVNRMGRELDMARAYLALMQLRMPDRLHFTVEADATAELCQCPSMTLLTLVENAVRHGIDPSLDGGRIDVSVRLTGPRCVVNVRDTGVGIAPTSMGLGTGLSTLRERLNLAFEDDAQLRLSEVEPHGVLVEIEFPAKT